MMAPTVDLPDDIIDPTRRVLRDHPVRTAVLYGSQVRGTATDESDIDIAVEFEPDLSVDDRHEARLELIVDLMDALDTDEVDVTDLSTVRPAIGASALNTGVVLKGDRDWFDRLRERFERRRTRRSHEERMKAFDELLDRMEEAV